MAGWNDHVTECYPKASIFDHKPIEPPELSRFVQIIMTEGVPYACSKFPLAFEFAREKAAARLGLQSKQISVTGSARIGYSLKPETFGRPFDENTSDIDLFAVDQDLFERVVLDFRKFVVSWEDGSIAPEEGERKFWLSSKERDPINIREGFLDIHHIPLKRGFETADKVSYAALVFDKNLESQVGRRIGSKIRIRIYRDWLSAINRIKYNIKSALKYRG